MTGDKTIKEESKRQKRGEKRREEKKWRGINKWIGDKTRRRKRRGNISARNERSTRREKRNRFRLLTTRQTVLCVCSKEFNESDVSHLRGAPSAISIAVIPSDHRSLCREREREKTENFHILKTCY